MAPKVAPPPAPNLPTTAAPRYKFYNLNFQNENEIKNESCLFKNKFVYKILRQNKVQSCHLHVLIFCNFNFYFLVNAHHKCHQLDSRCPRSAHRRHCQVHRLQRHHQLRHRALTKVLIMTGNIIIINTISKCKNEY